MYSASARAEGESPKNTDDKDLDVKPEKKFKGAEYKPNNKMIEHWIN
jgi:hypothetical protein